MTDADDEGTVPPADAPPQDAPAPDAPPPAAATEDTSPVGTVLNDNYRIVRLIGTGGMGEVYEGEHLFTGNRVAIKMILRELSADEAIVSLFRREARILFQLADDAIVRYLDSFHHAASDRYCLVMQYIDGALLADRIETSGALPEAEARALMRRLALGLGKAHALGVTHRDLSPDNVILREGSVERAALIDFGIATAEDMTEGTLFGRFAGKYRYVAPEQLGLFGGEVDRRTDVYGLGLLMAATLRGEGLDMGRSFPDAVKARAAVPVLDRVPRAMIPLLTSMLHPDPVDRPLSMAAVVDLLDGLPEPGAGGDRTVVSTARLSTPPVGIGASPTRDRTGGTDLGRPLAAGGTVPAEEGPFRLSNPVSAPPVAPKKARAQWPGILLIVALLAGGAWWWVARPLPQFAPQQAEGVTPPQPPEATPPSAPALPPPNVDTRAGFLAQAAADRDCTYVTRITGGAEAGRLAVFSPDGDMPNGLTTAYGDRFGLSPGTASRAVADGQCPVLDLARGLQGRDAVMPVVTLDTAELGAGDTVLGRVSQVRARGVWLGLVTDEGQVFDVSDWLEAQADGSLVFAIPLSGGEAGAPQLLVALASPEPLVTLATAQSDADAAALMPRLLEEASEMGAAAELVRFELRP